MARKGYDQGYDQEYDQESDLEYDQESDQEYDQEIWKITQRDEYPCPDDFSERMDLVYRSLPDDTVESKPSIRERWTKRISIPYFRYGLVAAGIACLLLVVVPVSANLSGYWRRMAGMTDGEKTQYVSDLENFQGGGDSYSRGLTNSEWDRMKKLTESYEEEGNYPTGAVVYVDSKEEVPQGQIGFCAKSSTFYVPDSEMTDEQLLEIIDFLHKREYSLAEHNGEETETPEEGNDSQAGDNRKLSRKAAVAVGVEWIEKIYGKSVTGWENHVEYEDDFEDSDGMYEITYREKDTSAEYFVSIGDVDGELLQLYCVYNGKEENTSKGLSAVSRKSVQKQYKEVKALAAKLDSSKEIVSGSCEYTMDRETGDLFLGYIVFWLEYDDGTGLRIAYSLNSWEYYQFEFLGREALQSRENDSVDTGLSIIKKKIKLK